MKHFFNLLAVGIIVLMLSSCGGDKVEVLEPPQINAKINVEIGHLANMSSVALNPAVANQVVAGSYDARLVLWDYETQHQIWTYKPGQTEEQDDFKSLVYTSDGKTIIGAAYNTVAFFDAEKGTLSKRIEVTGCSGECLSLTTDNKYIAVNAKDYTVAIIDVNAGSVVKTLTGHEGVIQDLCFSEDGKYLATASSDKTARIWDVEAGKVLKKVDVKEKVNAITISSEKKKFAFSVPDLDQIHVWDLEKMKSVNTIEEIYTRLLMFSGDNLLIQNNAKVEVLDIKDGSSLKTFKDYGWDLSIVGDKMASVGSRGVSVYNFESQELISNFGKDTRIVESIVVSKDGRFIATGNTHKDGSGGPDILSYPIDTSYKFTAYGTAGSGAGFFDFMGNQDVIFTEKYFGEAYFYDLKSGNPSSQIEDKVTDPFSFTSDGSLLIAKDYKNKNDYAIFDAKTGELKTKLVNSDAHLYFADITPDDKYYVLLTMDFCKVFELPSGKEVKSYEREDMDDIVFVDIDKDGKYVVGRASYKDFKIVDILTEEVTFIVKDIDAEDAALNKDKNTVAVACADWTVKIFDIAQNAQTLNLEEHKDEVRSVEYTPDGKYLISSAADGQMKIWDLTGKLLLNVIGLEKTSDYEGETKDFVVFTPEGRYDGTQAAIDKFIYFDENGERKPASAFKEQCYTPNLLGRTLGQNFIEEKEKE